MKRVLMTVIGVFLLVSGAYAAGSKVAFVDTQQIFDKTRLGQKYQSMIREYVENRRKILDPEYQDLQKAQEDFKKQAAMLNEKARKEKEESLANRINEFERKRSEFSSEIERKNIELSDEFQKNMQIVLKDVAKKEKVSMIINKKIDILGKSEVPSILYADEDLDLTDRVISEMDKKEGAQEGK